MLDALEKLAREAADEAGGDWFSPDLIESSLPIYSPRKARRYIAAASPDVVLKMVAVCRAAEAMLAPMAECQEIARLWEPDNSSGKERQWLVRGRDAAKALRSALAAIAVDAGGEP